MPLLQTFVWLLLRVYYSYVFECVSMFAAISTVGKLQNPANIYINVVHINTFGQVSIISTPKSRNAFPRRHIIIIIYIHTRIYVGLTRGASLRPKSTAYQTSLVGCEEWCASRRTAYVTVVPSSSSSILPVLRLVSSKCVCSVFRRPKMLNPKVLIRRPTNTHRRWLGAWFESTRPRQIISVGAIS